MLSLKALDLHGKSKGPRVFAREVPVPSFEGNRLPKN